MAWVKKTPEEKSEPTKRPKGMLFFYFVMMTISVAISTKLGLRKFYPSYPISWAEFYRKIPMIIGVSGLSSIVAWYFDLDGVERKVEMCDLCERVKMADDIFRCDCGGHFYDISEYKWVEDN